MIVSNRLPVSIQKVDGRLEFFPSTGGLATGLSSSTKPLGAKWIGWPGLASDGLTAAEKIYITKELRKRRCYPVFLTQKQIDNYYSGFSNSVIWPLFHGLPIRPYPKRFWRAYRQANQLFTDEALRISVPGSSIWVHDYHLLLMPAYLSRSGSDHKIGLFQHIPFPASDKLRSLDEAGRLLAGMLGADLVGFHTRGYTRHFLDACDSLLGLARHEDFVQVNDHAVRVAEFPMGIDYGRFRRTIRQERNRPALNRLRVQYQGRRVILAVDRLDPAKGLIERLQAYQQLLRENLELHGKIVFVMIVVPSRTDVAEYRQLKQRLDSLLLEVTTEFSRADWQPVDLLYQAFPLETIMLYYQLADVAFIAPLVDGMNLVAKEYVASKPQGNGALVLSSTAGAAEELRDAIQVDPTKRSSVVNGLRRALNLSKQELQTRARRMQRHIEQFSVQHWAHSFLDTLQRPREVRHPLPKALTPRRLGVLMAAYHRAAKRLILLDYDGTLREFVNDPMAAKPTTQILRTLRRLGDNPGNEVVLVSDRERHNLDSWFGTLPLALAAEHGAFFRRRGGKNWHRTSQTDSSWQEPVKDLFEYYAAATPGALVEQKNAALVWHYRAASPYQAQKSLVAIHRLLKPLLTRYGLIAKSGNKVLEVHPSDIGKGNVIQEWLIHDHDFVLCIGDDTTDEDMFRALPAGAYGVKVGSGSTAARFRVKNVAAVVGLLSKL